MFKIDYTSFGLGILLTLIVGFVVLLVLNHRRHSCHHCGRRTKKTCRMYVHPITPDSTIGFKHVSIYAHYECPSCRTATVKVIDMLKPDYQIKAKPPEEFDFNSPEARRLFALTPHVRNPSGSGVIIRTHFGGELPLPA